MIAPRLDPGLVFDEARHAYTLDGVRVPGVTSVLKPISQAEYGMVDPAVLEQAAAFGRAVHRMIELDLLGLLDEDTLDDALRPYLAQWRRFLATSGFVPMLSESRVASRRWKCAGTLDIFGTLRGRLALVDAKCVVRITRGTGPQTAGYETLLREWRPELFKPTDRVDRYALQLSADAHRLHPLKNPSDARVFLAALTLHNFIHEAAA